MLESANIETNLSLNEKIYWAFMAFYRNPNPNDLTMGVISTLSHYAEKGILTKEKIEEVEKLYLFSDRTGALSDTKGRKIPKRSNRMKWFLKVFMSYYLGRQKDASTNGKPLIPQKGMTIEEVLSFTRSSLSNIPIEDVDLYVILPKKDTKNPKYFHAESNDIVSYISVGDTLLLSDRVTHHYSQVYDISEGYIYLVEPRIDDFFLLEDFNQEDIKADKIYKNGKLIYKVSLSELKKVCKAIVTIRGGEIPMSIGIKLKDGELRL